MCLAAFRQGRIWGDWQLVYQKNAQEATRSQKALAPWPQYSNFLMAEYGTEGLYGGYRTKVFRNIVKLQKRLELTADVAYTPPAKESEHPARLASSISKATLEYRVGQRFGWKPLRIPLPLKGEGWLDVTYCDGEMRITRGNRGGVFVHLRPELLSVEAAKEA